MYQSQFYVLMAQIIQLCLMMHIKSDEHSKLVEAQAYIDEVQPLAEEKALAIESLFAAGDLNNFYLYVWLMDLIVIFLFFMQDYQTLRLSHVDKNMPRQVYVLPEATKLENCCTAPFYFGYNYLQVYRFAYIKTLLLLI